MLQPNLMQQLHQYNSDLIISTDPPYYDNIGYADLSDFFYVWLRRSLQPVFPDLFSTLAVPKAEELVATPYRHGGKDKAEAFFMDGMTQAMNRLAEQSHPAFPVTIYYAFKQSERKGTDNLTYTGWETFLEALIRAGFGPQRYLADAHRAREPHDRLGHQRPSPRASSSSAANATKTPPRPRAANSSPRSRRNSLRPSPCSRRATSPPVDLAQAAIGPGNGRLYPVLPRAGKRRFGTYRPHRAGPHQPGPRRDPRRAGGRPRRGTAAGLSPGSSSTASPRASTVSPRPLSKAKKHLRLRPGGGRAS